jgi:hypothetical protein
MLSYPRCMRFRLVLHTSAAASGTRSTRASSLPSTRNPFTKWALRRNADVILRGGARVHPESTLLAWRAAELTSVRKRRRAARSLRGVVRGLDGNALPGAVPLNRRGVRPYTAALVALAERVGDVSRPVAPRGMLLLEDLLMSGDSPLYARENLGLLPESLREIEHALGKGV